MILPQKNAKLVDVVRGGTSEDYAQSAGGGADVLARGVDAYVTERRATFAEAQALNRSTISYAIVPGDTGIVFALGDTLRFEQNGGTFERTVREVRNRQVDGLSPQPVRIDFEEA